MLRAEQIELRTIDMPFDMNDVKWKVGIDCKSICIFDREISIALDNGHWLNYPKENILYYDFKELPL